jgi:tetratricopeptide (TPR) repeat protein
VFRISVNIKNSLIVALVAAVLSPVSVSAATTEDTRLDQLERNLDAWRLEVARAYVDTHNIEAAAEPRAAYLLGKLLFFEGDCRKALKKLREAIEGNRAELGWKAVRDRAEETETVFATLEHQKGPSGKFNYRFTPGLDEILVSYADNVLVKQLEQLKTLLGDNPVRPIEVAILADTKALSAVSGLSVEQIERTGTVGVTKYGRIMIVSPRNLVKGYPWLDTLAHELTHFFITRISRNNTPIWLHEGIAKLLEREWRSKKLQELTPEEAYLLDRAVKEGRLIPLRRFHPSVAHLSDQEEAALAYAQVLSFLKYLDNRMPENWIRDLLNGLANGQNINGVLVSLINVNLQRLFMWWRKSAAGRRHTPTPAVGLLKKQFKRGAVAGKDEGESLHILEVRRHLRLGDLLRLRGHIEAAATEFSQAKELARFPSPEISDRLGASLLELGEIDQVISLLEPMVTLYPSHANTYVQLAKALASRNEVQRALAVLDSANAINPFDPDIHCLMSTLYYEMDQEAAAAREKSICQAALAQSGKKIIQ